MISFDFTSLTVFLNTYPPEVIGIMSFAFCIISIFVLFHFFKEQGLVLYAVIALIAANIQVLKAAQYSFYSYPIVLGTLAFSTTFLVMDILTEWYGAGAARRAIWLSFSGCLLIMGFMFLTLSVSPLQLALESPDAHFNCAHNAIATLFSPTPAIFTASLISYVISQYSDVGIYQWIKKLTYHQALWLRTSISNVIASLIDTIIFSTLAWVIFAPHPLDFDTLVYTYMLGTYGFRLIVLLMNIPVMYVFRRYAQPKVTPNVSLS
ncbi:MAG: queuosine precursor transporter [Janthinobacterium lividum]